MKNLEIKAKAFSVGLGDSLEYFLNRRAAVIQCHNNGYDWVANDPVAGFVAPMLWYLNREEGNPFKSIELSRRTFLLNDVRFKFMRNRLKKVLSGLRDKGIPVIVLKGALLAETLYESPGFRLMSDIDLLVRHCDWGG